MSVRLISPANPLSPVTVIVAEDEEGTLAWAGVDALIEKSWNRKSMMAVWTSVLLVPVRITV